MRIARRRILSGFAACAAGSLLAAGRWPARAAEAVRSDVAARLAALYSARDSAAAIGRAYLAQAPAEADRARLVALLCPGASHQEMAALPLRRLHAIAASRHAEDFAAGRIVSLNGWLLSLSEARLCALAELTA